MMILLTMLTLFQHMSLISWKMFIRLLKKNKLNLILMTMMLWYWHCSLLIQLWMWAINICWHICQLNLEPGEVILLWVPLCLLLCSLQMLDIHVKILLWWILIKLLNGAPNEMSLEHKVLEQLFFMIWKAVMTMVI